MVVVVVDVADEALGAVLRKRRADRRSGSGRFGMWVLCVACLRQKLCVAHLALQRGMLEGADDTVCNQTTNVSQGWFRQSHIARVSPPLNTPRTYLAGPCKRGKLTQALHAEAPEAKSNGCFVSMVTKRVLRATVCLDMRTGWRCSGRPGVRWP